ncbi:MAG: 7-cyano-7-deazaguanine synthase [Candidatus Neomarinimicrobiota bacterium]
MKTGHEKTVIGLSGGIDSALVASIAVSALGKKNVCGISLPSKFSSAHSLNDAKQLATNLGIEYQVIKINSIIESFETTLKPSF